MKGILRAMTLAGLVVALLAVSSLALTDFSLALDNGSTACCSEEGGADQDAPCASFACPCVACGFSALVEESPRAPVATATGAAPDGFPRQDCLSGIARSLDRPPKSV